LVEGTDNLNTGLDLAGGLELAESLITGGDYFREVLV
jgi:hypothetical protein